MRNALASAGTQLLGVSGCRIRRSACASLCDRTVAPRPFRIASMAGIIGEIKAVGIVERDAVQLVAPVVVPADKMNGIGEVRSPCAPPPRLGLVGCPGAIESLRIAIGGGRPLPWHLDNLPAVPLIEDRAGIVDPIWSGSAAPEHQERNEKQGARHHFSLSASLISRKP